MRYVYVTFMNVRPNSNEEIVVGVYTTLKKARDNRPDACGHDRLVRFPVDRIGPSKQLPWVPGGRA